MGIGLAVAGGIKAVGAIKARKEGNRAASAQNEIDQQNIARLRAENDETIKRTGEGQERAVGSAKTSVGGGGFQTGKGSQADYVTAMEASYKDDLDWMKKSAESNVDIRQSEAANRYEINRSAVDQQFIQGIGSAVSTGASAWGSVNANGWWG